MCTSNSSINAETTNGKPFLKLCRKESVLFPGVYELNTLSLCKLVDGLTKGEFIQYSACTLDGTRVQVDHTKTFECFSHCLAEKLPAESVKALFGDIELTTPEEFEFFISQCSVIQNEDCDNIIKWFIHDKYDIFPEGDYKIKRKENSEFVNY